MINWNWIGIRCGTLLEAAIKKGMVTGLVATNPVTDATPAAFSAHVDHRNKQDTIAFQQIKQLSDIFGTSTKKYGVDLLMGGGRAYFLPKESDGSQRKDSTDVISVSFQKSLNNLIICIDSQRSWISICWK